MKQCKHCHTAIDLRTNKNGIIYNCCVSCYTKVELPLRMQKTTEALKEKYGVINLGALRKKRLEENPTIHKEKKKPVCKYCGSTNIVSNIKTGKRLTYFTTCEEHWERYQNDKTEKRKKSNLEKFGVEYAMHSIELCIKHNHTINNRTDIDKLRIEEKREATNLKKYGVKHPIQLTEIKEKRTKAFFEKYGVNTPMHIPEFVQKQKQTLISNYGVDNPLKSDEIKNKVMTTNIKRYGSACPLQNKTVRAKANATLLNKYGVTIPIQNIEVEFKRIQTNINKYGEACSLKNKEISDKAKFTKKCNYWETFIELLNKKKLIPLFTKEFYINGKEEAIFSYKCERCGKHFETPKFTVQRISCGCTPNRSHYEDEIIDWLTTINIFSIKPNEKFYENGKAKFEIDIYVIEHSFGIDFNGLFWHSNFNKRINYHQEKWKYFKDKNIQFIQIFENEWLSKQELVKSIILNKLGVSSKISARKCIIQEVNYRETKSFLKLNHIQGYAVSSFNIGLYYNNDLVALATFGKPRFEKEKKHYELIRFCNKINTTVIGGFQRLLKHFENSAKPEKLISYVDLRYFNGNSYISAGFVQDNITSPNYYYFKSNDPSVLYNRMQFQKHKLKDKLEIFDPTLSEADNMTLNNYLRIYDAGNLKMIKNY